MNLHLPARRIATQLHVKDMLAFSLIEVCISAVILAIIGAQMYRLSSLTRDNFKEAKNYLEADNKIYSEIAFARNAALRYSWCDALIGVDQDPLTFERKTVVNSSYSKISDFCADEFYAKSPVSVYRPPYILTETDSTVQAQNRKCYGFDQAQANLEPAKINLLPIGSLKIVAGSQDKCERDSNHLDEVKYPEYKPWDLFLQKCREDMNNNSYEPTRTVDLFPEKRWDGSTQPNRVPAEKDPIVGNLVKQLEGHAQKNNIMTRYYNRSSIDLKISHRIILFYTVNLDIKGTTRSVTRVLYLNAPLATWCPY